MPTAPTTIPYNGQQHGNNFRWEWPTVHDLTLDMLQYSIHLPFITQTTLWPATPTEEAEDLSSTPHQPSDSVTKNKSDRSSNHPEQINMEAGGVVRVLNIVVEETRILQSRERCPFLIHVEVADTGMEGNDTRLYATKPSAPSSYSTDDNGFFATIQEALHLQQHQNTYDDNNNNNNNDDDVDDMSNFQYQHEELSSAIIKQNHLWGVKRSSSVSHTLL
jgi:hypothetical protein